MSRKIPVDAFEAYYALGPGRSYEALAAKYGVTKRAVTALAVREAWQRRILDVERKARERSDQALLETVEAMQTRHLKTLQAVMGRALEALRTMPLESAMEAVKAIEMVIRQERLTRGEPTEHTALDIERIIKREYALVMTGGADEAQEASVAGERDG